MELRQADPADEHPRRWQRLTRHVIACLLGGFLVALPAATVHALTATRIHDDVGIVPATLSLAPGHSTLETGLLGGSIYDTDFTRYGLGAKVTLDGPPGNLAQIHSLASPELKKAAKVYTSMFNHPDSIRAGYSHALREALTSNLIRMEIAVGLALAAAVFVISVLGNVRSRRRTTTVALGVLLVLSVGHSVHRFVDWQQANAIPTPTYPITMLDDTALANARVDNRTTAALIDNVIPLAQREIRREREANREFVSTAYDSIGDLLDTGAIAVPTTGQTACLLLSDLHANGDMIAVYRRLVWAVNETYGPGTLAVTYFDGDQTYGSAAAKTAVDQMGKISRQEYAVVGNHDSTQTIEQLDEAGIHILDGSAQETDNGLTAVGVTDPQLTKQGPLFAADTISRPGYEGVSEGDAGRTLLAAMRDSHPTLGLSHEAYAFAPILGIDDMSRDTMTTWFEAGSHGTASDSGAVADDGVPDIPAAAVAYGHWHRGFHYRVAGNSDGTWTVVMELGTAGGASTKLSLSHFSTPQTIPGKQASAAIMIVDDDSGLVTAVQELTTARDGTVSAGPVHPVGSPDGQPYPTGPVNP